MLFRQALLASTAGLLFCIAVVVLARRRLLSFRYAIGWLFVGVALVLAGVGLGLVQPLSRFLSVTPTTLVLGGVLATLLLICVQLSISLSGSNEQIRSLNDSVALLDARIQHLEAQS